MRGCASKLACGHRIGPAECAVFTVIFGEFRTSHWADRVVGPYGGAFISRYLCRGGRLCPPGRMCCFYGSLWRIRNFPMGRCGHRPLQGQHLINPRLLHWGFQRSKRGFVSFSALQRLLCVQERLTERVNVGFRVVAGERDANGAVDDGGGQVHGLKHVAAVALGAGGACRDIDAV